MSRNFSEKTGRKEIQEYRAEQNKNTQDPSDGDKPKRERGIKMKGDGKAKNHRLGVLIAAFVFLMNPDIGIFDILPDFVGIYYYALP